MNTKSQEFKLNTKDAMTKKLILPSLLFLSLTGFSQTKWIAHRSHSGNDQNFTLKGPDNLGAIIEINEVDLKEYEKLKEKEIQRILEEEKRREHEKKVIDEAIKKEAERKALLEKQKKEQEIRLNEKNKTYAKDSAVKVNSAKVIKDTTAKTHKRQYYSPYGLPTNRTPKPEVGIQLIKSRFNTGNTNNTIQADISIAAWLLISAAVLSCFFVKK